MIEQLLGEFKPYWDQLMVQLGWGDGPLSWVQILVIVLAAVGTLIILRNLIGGHSGGGGGGTSTVAYPPNERTKGLPTRYYTGSARMGDFSIPAKVYDFKVPSPTPNLSKLKESVNLDMDKARELFLPAGRRVSDSLNDFHTGESSESGLPAGPQTGEEKSSTSQFAVPFWGIRRHGSTYPSPDWKLARKLFIPGGRK